MKLVIGLGNPGASYADTYHNVGFMAADVLKAKLDGSEFAQKPDALISECGAGSGKLFIIKPLTYMNLSGDAVLRYSRYYKIAPRDILVIYDDIDIKKGTVRARYGGSAGTHNGMRDIVAKLGSTEFARVRIGTGLKPQFMDLADYVLSHIQAFEKPLIDKAVEAAAELAVTWTEGKQWQDMTVAVK